MSTLTETKVSYFENYFSREPKEVSLLNFLQSDVHKDIVMQIRGMRNKDDRKKLKSKLPGITVSGIFTERRASALVKHSGYICIDIDGGDNPHLTDFKYLRNELRKIKNVAYAGLSVSGEGVFCLIKLSNPEKHKEHFKALQACFDLYGITIDKACSDVSRLRGYSYDPEAYYNDDAIAFNQTLDLKAKLKQQPQRLKQNDLVKAVKDGKGTRDKVMDVITKICSNGTDITDSYKAWMEVAASLASEFGEEGRNMFHLVSQNHPEYNETVCDNKFTEFSSLASSFTIGTFFYYAQQHGI